MTGWTKDKAIGRARANADRSGQTWSVFADASGWRCEPLAGSKQPTAYVIRPYDPPYANVTCSKCGRKYQRLDYGNAAHQLTCGCPLPPQVEPQPGKSLSLGEWRQFDADNGIKR